MMHAITFKQFGLPDVLELTKVPKPVPSQEQLLVQVKATALNRADCLQRRGKYPPPPGESEILGLEIAGVVVDKGKNTRFAIGDRVFGLVAGGGYAEYCVIDHEVAMPIPNNFSFEEAAAIPEAFLTAYEAIFTLGELKSDENILIHAGASGVGSAGIQLAKNIGATVYATVRTPEKISFVEALGAQMAIDEKVDVIIDFIGGEAFTKNIERLNSCGRLICVGRMSGARAEIDLDQIVKRRLQIKGLVMRTRSLTDKRAIAKHFSERFGSALQSRKIKPIIDSVYPLDKAALAHKRMEQNLNQGKILLKI